MPDIEMHNPTVIALKHPYISVYTGGGTSFGGSQMWFGKPKSERKGIDALKQDNRIRCYGCGLVSALDIFDYVSASANGRDPEVMNKEQYMKHLREYDEGMFHTLYYMGIPGTKLARKLNRLFKKHNLKLKADWGVAVYELVAKLEEMIKNDLPATLSVGPAFLKKDRLNLYKKKEKENGVLEFTVDDNTKDHYVTVTGMIVGEKNRMLEISSWGRKYYIDLDEYISFVDRNDNTLFSNIVYIKFI